MPSSRPRLFLIDTFGLIFRAFYGRARSGAPLMRTAAGMPTEAIYIFVNMMRRMLQKFHPEYIAAVWEGEGPTFRDELFSAYKATRTETPDDLLQQMPYIQRLLEASRIPVLSQPGYEADDVIGALAHQAAEHDIEVYVISSDKDLSQLVDGDIYMLNPMKDDLLYDSANVEELMGVTPRQVVDLLALKGDSVDNIPGAPGIGDKGARDLIATYGSVENAIEHAAEVKRKTYRESLLNNREQILLSKKLATIAVDAPIRLDLDALKAAEPDTAALADLYRELEFNSLLSQLDTPAEESKTECFTAETAAEFADWLAKAGPADPKHPLTLVVDLPETADWSDEAGVIEGGVAFCVKPGKACLLPARLLNAAKKPLEDSAVPKRIHDWKAAIRRLASPGITLAAVADDTMLEAFLVDSSRADYSLSKSLGRYLATAQDSSLARTADLNRRLGDLLAKELDSRELRQVYETIELPLAPILAHMESAGILIDSPMLAALSSNAEAKIGELSQEIYELAGVSFNINSPKQLGEILFDKLNLPKPGRRGKTKTPSTASDVLEALAPAHPIASKVLEHRQLSKLKGTYIDALPALVDPSTGRLHTTFNQAGAATGRLSSYNPNLQNIPIRTELGREIRAAFISRPGWNLLAADYSQIELRILAHISGDPVLTDAFRRGEDIHTRTAAEVFGVPPLMVGAEERRRAKAVNFGIAYGLSPFGLSQQLGIPMGDARQYIDAYFSRYAGVKKFMNDAIRQAKDTGYARTLVGRLRPIHDLDSKNPAARGFAERTAINSPIQGSAADIIKVAMIRVDERLREQDSRALMLLQVHDELVFEVPEKETAAVAEMVKREMERAYPLKVPLIADVKAGKNWRDLTPG